MKRGRTAAIVAGYLALFWVVLPLALWLAAAALDRRLGQARPWPWLGGLLAGLGLALVAWAMLELRRSGRGWPIGALPPQRLTRRGPYRHVRHPIYLGFNLALLGAGLVAGSPGLAFVVAPGFVPFWLAYAQWEERGLCRRFGASYGRYKRQVGLLPRLGFVRLTQAMIALRVFSVRVLGPGRIPREGPVVLVANHACYLDPVYVGAATLRPVHYMTTAESYRRGFMGWLMRRFVNVPVRRYRQDPAACRELLRLLGEGEVVGVFPEGERTPLGDYQGADRTVAGVLARLAVPVVPVGVSGAYDCGPRWAGVLRRRPVRVRVGAPLTWAGREPKAVIDDAIRALIEDPQPLHLARLPRSRLARVLWRCPLCLDEAGWRAPELACARCGVVFEPTAEGRFRDEDGGLWTLAELGREIRSAPEAGALSMAAVAFYEPSLIGPIRPLHALGDGVLHVEAQGLRFGGLVVPLAAIRSIGVEGADTLQVASRERMWQFRLGEDSAFRACAALERWIGPTASRRAVRGAGPASRALLSAR